MSCMRENIVLEKRRNLLGDRCHSSDALIQSRVLDDIQPHLNMGRAIRCGQNHDVAEETQCMIFDVEIDRPVGL